VALIILENCGTALKLLATLATVVTGSLSCCFTSVFSVATSTLPLFASGNIGNKPPAACVAGVANRSWLMAASSMAPNGLISLELFSVLPVLRVLPAVFATRRA
jgi:hypothetical protein